MGRKRDQIWDHAEDLNGRFKCNYCKLVFAGGVSRIKAHIVGKRGRGIAICKAVPEDFRKEAYLATEVPNKKIKIASTSSSAMKSTNIATEVPNKKIKSASTSSSAMKSTNKIVSQSKEEYIGRRRDQFWEHAEVLDGGFKCLYCEYQFTGGVSRIKSHLAGVKGQGIVICEMVPEDVKMEAYQAIEGTLKKHKSASTSSSAKESKITSTSMEKNVTQSKDEYVAEILYYVVDKLVANMFSLLCERLDFEWSFKFELFDLVKFIKIKFMLHDAQKRQVHSRKQMVDQGCRYSVYNPDRVKTITELLDRIVNEAAGFGLGIEFVNSIPKISLDKNIDSLLDDSEVVGRGSDVVRIVQLLTSSSNKQVISVLPIVGMAGLGKTTLANLVYNHELVKKHFDVLAWVHVSKNFNIKGILREIVQSFNEKLIGLEDEEMDEIIQYLQSKLRVKKYLLILDDVHDEDPMKWNTLKSYLLDINSNAGNYIVFTTRNENVARIMATDPLYYLDKLSKDDCWYVFKKRAFFEEIPLTSNLEAIGGEIAQKCGGLPWAARVLGGTMYFKDNIGRSNSALDGRRVPSIVKRKLYDDGGYCCKMNDLMHDLALSISKSEILISEGNLTDDINHVRQLVVRSDGETIPKIPFPKDGFMKLRTFVLENTAFSDILSNFGCLRVLKLSGNNIIELSDSIGELIHLRFLHLSHTKIKELPTSITQLYNLQTLRIECCRYLKMLPEDLSNLIKLRHFILEYYMIKRTPKYVGRLTSLHGLPSFIVNPNAGCQINELGYLNQLRGELDIYSLEHVSDKVEARSANLAAKTKIYKLGLHWDIDFDMEGNYDSNGEALLVKKYNDEDVLEGLQPHQYLKSLTIEGFKGDKFPSWMLTGAAGDGLSLFDNLIEITLSYCSKCEEVPTLGHLPSLRVLEIRGMHNVRCIGTKFYSDGSYKNALFPALRRLVLQQMVMLEEWKDAEELTRTTCEVFPCIQELIIEDCFKLTSAPYHFPSLKKLKISNIRSTTLEKISSKFTTPMPLNIMRMRNCDDSPIELLSCKLLEELRIEECPNLISIPNLRELHSLVELEISKCQKLKCLPEGLDSLTSLRSLRIGGYCEELDTFPSLSIQPLQVFLQELYLYGWAKLKTLPDEIQCFTTLKYLTIISFNGIEALPEWLGKIFSLQELSLFHCNNLMYLPSTQAMRHLIRLEISDCPKLKKRCAMGSGVEWSKIAHIRHIKIKPYY
uniref:BED-type domain-containing protein n=1 Tax=Fagus sylvatica TaxID=28930 RepID=A0A2N9FF07_FAGSY